MPNKCADCIKLQMLADADLIDEQFREKAAVICGNCLEKNKPEEK